MAPRADRPGGRIAGGNRGIGFQLPVEGLVDQLRARQGGSGLVEGLPAATHSAAGAFLSVEDLRHVEDLTVTVHRGDPCFKLGGGADSGTCFWASRHAAS